MCPNWDIKWVGFKTHLESLGGKITFKNLTLAFNIFYQGIIKKWIVILNHKLKKYCITL